MTNEPSPEFIKPKTVMELSIEKLQEEVARKQERRLLVVGALELTGKQRAAARNVQVAEKFEKAERKLAKILEAIDKRFEEVNAILAKCRAMQLEYDDTVEVNQLIKGV